MIKTNSIVTRKSYNNDIIFRVIKIKDSIAYLKGTNVRLYADAPLSDLEETEQRDDFEPEIDDELNRDEFFFMPAKILHLDGDEEYLNKSIDFYKKCGVLAIGKKVNEKDMPNEIVKILNEINPDILVLTGHDAFYEKQGSISDINNYKNSKYYALAVRNARTYEKSHEKLVIIAGACQSDYETILKSGANYASSPKRVNIHALDPAIIAVNVAKTNRDKLIDIKELLNKTKYGSDGIGGLVGNGMMYIGYPR